jgi:oligopeptide transport system substrate-binding protein
LTSNLGIKVTLDPSDYKTHVNKLSSRTYEIAQSFWVAQYRDPMNILERFKYLSNTKNYPGWENPNFSQLLEKSMLDPTPEERAKTLELAEGLFLERSAPCATLPLVICLHDPTLRCRL